MVAMMTLSSDQQGDRPGSMVIEIAVKLVTFVFIVDNSAARKKCISPSFFTI
jgi:hypothetical protein